MPATVRANRDVLTCVLAHVSDDEVVALTQRLVRIPSVFRPDDPDANEAAVAHVVAEWLHAEGLAVLVEPVAPGRPNVVASLAGAPGGPTLVLEGHTDVVTEGDARAWRHGPWSGVLEDGRLYGRGAADMKGGLAAAMAAAAALKRAGVRLGGTLVVAALVDEEAGMTGARQFVRTPLGRAMDAAIICEPEQNELCLEQKGVFWARVTIHGRMAHGAMPYAGVNPIAAAGAFLGALPRLERRVGRGVPRSRFLGRPHITPTRCRAPLDGVAQDNVIPSRAGLVLDVRLTPGLAAETVRAALDGLARDVEARQPGIKVEVETVAPPRPPTKTPRNAAVVRALGWAVSAVTGRRPRFGGVPGSTDGTIFVAERGIPIVTFGPGNRQVPHQVDEHVEVTELVEAARCYAAAALRFLGAS
ncbi:MAG TPA: M20 family metallopeptidase [Methylomirabilota bacterium]|nr:M20 family metallopeptidase [Methylomirabilota bacterium]